MRPDLICICVPVVVSSHCIPFSICPLLDEDDRAELEKKIRYRQKFSDALNKEGIEVTEETHGDEVFMLLHVPFKRLCMEAERSKLEMGLKGVRGYFFHGKRAIFHFICSYQYLIRLDEW